MATRKLSEELGDTEARSSDEDPQMVSAEQPADDTNWLQLAQDAYTASTDYFDATVRQEIEQDLRQWQSLHSRQSKYSAPENRGKSNLFRPKTRSSVQKAEAQAAEALFSTVDVINLVPDDMDDEVAVMQAKFKEALIKPRLAKRYARGGLDWYLTCMGAFQETMVPGVCISRTEWIELPKKGISQPGVSLVPIENFRFDPAADWRRAVHDSPYLIEAMPMYCKDVKLRWPNVEEGVILSAARELSDSIRLQRENKRKDSTTLSHAVNDFSIVWVHSNIIEHDGQDWHYFTLGTSHMLDEAPVELAERYPHGRPYDVGFSTIEAHKHYPMSAVRLGRDLQREINELANQRVENVRRVLNKRFFGKRGARIDIGAITRNTIGSLVLVDDVDTDVKPIEIPDVTSSSYKESDLLNIEFDSVIGQFDQSSVQSNKNLNETVGGMQMLTASGNLMGGYRLKTFVETWLEPVLAKLVELEMLYEDDENAIIKAARQADAVATEVDEVSGEEVEYYEVGPEILMQGEHEVRVDMTLSAVTPMEKANLLMYGFTQVRMLLDGGILQQLGLDVKELVKEVFSMIGYRDGSRFFQWDDTDPAVAGLQMQVEELQQALDAKHPPELMQAQVDKLIAETEKLASDKVSKMVEAIYSAMQAGQVVQMAPSVAPMADDLLASAGFERQPPDVDPNLMSGVLPAPDQIPAPVEGDVPHGTNPDMGVYTGPPDELGPPEPAQPDDGEGMGIETMRADGVRS